NAGRSRSLGPASGATMVDPTGTNHNRRGVVVGAGNQVIIQESGTGLISIFGGTTGMPGWVYAGANGTGFEAYPVLAADNLVYATTNYGKLFVVDYVTGLEAWTLQLSGSFSAPVIAAPGTLYYGSNAPYGFYAVDTVARKKK